jgi:mannitol/fructose-specific phosphotransferase system IIA component (Ntr-type)
VHLRDFLTPPRVAVQLVAEGKDHVLSQLVALASPNPAVHDAILDELRAREAAFPTALGDGVALPHVRTTHVDTVLLAAAVLAKPLPFGAADGNAVDLFFLVLSPKSAASEHLRVLRSLSRLVSEPRTVTALRTATSVGAFLATVESVAPF